MGEVKQVIVIRREYPDGSGGVKKLRRGKEIAQGSHASIAFLVNKLRGKEGRTKINISDDIVQWINEGQTKICLVVKSEEELLSIFEEAKSAGLESNIITDAGRTEFDGEPTKTAVSIGPNDAKAIDKITGDLKLY